jgi:aspartate 1-decarboxylase
MQRILMKSKIHRATVTGCCLAYEGSVTIDSLLLRAADILPGEQVHVLDLDNGERLVTYAIAGEEGSGTIQLNGAAARLVNPGDTVILISYANVDEDEAAGWQARVVKVDGKNRQLEGGR